MPFETNQMQKMIQLRKLCGRARWRTPITLAFWRQRQEDQEFQARLGYTATFEARKQVKSWVAQTRKQKQEDHQFKACLDYCG